MYFSSRRDYLKENFARLFWTLARYSALAATCVSRKGITGALALHSDPPSGPNA
jgi:hypothetical protein